MGARAANTSVLLHNLSHHRAEDRGVQSDEWYPRDINKWYILYFIAAIPNCSNVSTNYWPIELYSEISESAFAISCVLESLCVATMVSNAAAAPASLNAAMASSFLPQIPSTH